VGDLFHINSLTLKFLIEGLLGFYYLDVKASLEGRFGG